MPALPSRLAFPALVVGPVIIIGCQKSVETTAETPATEQKAADQVEDPKPSTRDDPAASWTHALDDIVEGKIEDVAAALPHSYRNDLNRTFGIGLKPLDPQVRREAAHAIAAFAQTLAEKEKFVLGSSRFNFGGPAAPFVRAHLAELCRVVVAVAKWPGWSAVEAPDTVSLVQEVVLATISEPRLIGSLKSVRFQNTGAQKDDSQAHLLVSTPSMTQPRTVEVVRIEDRWLPKSLVDGWSEMFGAGRADALAAGAISRENWLRAQTSRLREITRSLDSIKTQAEFDELVERASTLLMASAADANTMPRRVETEELVTVVVQGRLTDEEKDRLVWELSALSDEPVSSLADATEEPNGEAFVIHVGPVQDVASFAKRLQGLVVEEVDASARKITARIAAP